MGAIFFDERFQLHAELAHGPVGQGLQPHTLLGPGDLVTVGGVGQLGDEAGGLVNLLTYLGSGLGRARSLSLQAVTLLLRLGSPGGRRLLGRTCLVTHVGSHGQGSCPAPPGPLGRRPRLALAPGGCAQGVGASTPRALAFLGRAQGEPGLGLGAACLTRGRGRLLALSACGLQTRVEVLRPVVLLALQLGQGGRGRA